MAANSLDKTEMLSGPLKSEATNIKTRYKPNTTKLEISVNFTGRPTATVARDMSDSYQPPRQVGTALSSATLANPLFRLAHLPSRVSHGVRHHLGGLNFLADQVPRYVLSDPDVATPAAMNCCHVLRSFPVNQTQDAPITH
jgi:hypothetical protein